jgi:hypothetical protein
MRHMLAVTSMAYAGILVAALAGVLATILVLLVRVTRILGRVQVRLGEVVRSTQPLAGRIGAMTTAAVTSTDELSRGVDTFVAAAGDPHSYGSDTRS